MGVANKDNTKKHYDNNNNRNKKKIKILVDAFAPEHVFSHVLVSSYLPTPHSSRNVAG